MINVVSFPGLGFEFELNRVAVELFGRPIYWYGIIIATGMLLAVYLCGKWGPRFGINEEQILDMMLFAVPAALVAVRAYYVLFNLDNYRLADGSLDWSAILRYSDGGLAIYGAIISSAIVLLIFCRVRKISFLAYADLGVHGLFIGQIMGRWGNFMNVEAFGGITDAPWRMCAESITGYLVHHGYAGEEVLAGLLEGTAAQAIGYKELLAHFRGEMTLEAAADLIRQKSRNYAKRQLTWFRRDERVKWVVYNAPEAAPEVLQEATEYLQQTLYNDGVKS